MKIIELLAESTSQFDPLLIKFWNKHQDKLPEYFRTGETGCVEASNDLASEIGGFAEVVPIGRFSGSKKVGGWLYTDTPQTDLESFTQKEIIAMKKQGLDPNNEQDRVTFITNNKLEDEFRWIPHSWVEVRGKILDPSGFYVDGKSGQFDRLVNNKSNLSQRYTYF